MIDKLRTLALAAAVALASATAALAQYGGPPTPLPVGIFGATASLSVTSSTGNVAIPAGSASENSVLIQNDGTAEVFVKLGSSAVTAATTDFPLQAGASVSTYVGASTNVAAITSTGSSTLRVTRTNGAVSGGGGGGAQQLPVPGPAVGSTTASLSATTATSSIPLPSGPANLAYVYVSNEGPSEAFVALGGNTVTAATTSFPLIPGQGTTLAADGATYLAAITSTGTATLRATWTSGVVFGARGGGGAGYCGTAGDLAYYPSAGLSIACAAGIAATGTGALSLSSSLTVGAGSPLISTGPGGALGSNAFTSTAYAPLASPTFSGVVGMPDGSTWTSVGLTVAGPLTLSETLAQQTAISAPSSVCSTSLYSSAFSCDLSHLPFGVGLQITGAATLGEPATGYSITPNLSLIYGYYSNFSGWNQSVSSNVGRTGATAVYIKADNYGQGDTSAYFGNVFVDNALAGATTFLANPAGSILGGQCFGGQSGVYCQGIGDINCSDKPGGTAYDIACILFTGNLNRNNNTAALGETWIGARYQCIGTLPCDAGISLAGSAGYYIGVDLVDSTYGTGQAAIAMGANQRIYLGATAGGGTNFPQNVTLGTTYITYSSSSTALQGVANNATAFLFAGGSGVNSFIYSGLGVGYSQANHIRLNGAGTGNPPTIAFGGSDTNVSGAFTAQGAAGFIFQGSGVNGFVFGPNGGTNPSFLVDGSASSAVTGLLVTSEAAGAGVLLSVTSTGNNESLHLNAKGSGSIIVGNVSTGVINFGSQIASTTGTPTIASGACGASTNGAVVSGSTNQSGQITIGSASTTSCTIAWSATLPATPGACEFFPMNAAAAATGTTVAYVGAPTTVHVVLSGSALANANYGYVCL